MTLYWPPPEHVEYITDRRPAGKRNKKRPIRR